MRRVTALPAPPGAGESGAAQSDQYEVGVHIADVSHFLTEGSALDTEARARATSVYLVQKVIPMLPPILCEELCSLNPNKDRLAFSCIFRLTEDGSLVEGHSPWFGRTVIRSCAKLDYPTAQRMVDGDIPSFPFCSYDSERSESVSEDRHVDALPEDVWEFSRRPTLQEQQGGHRGWEVARDVKLLHKIAMARRKSRVENGALSLKRWGTLSKYLLFFIYILIMLQWKACVYPR